MAVPSRVARIVPAIPHRLSRTAPAESSKPQREQQAPPPGQQAPPQEQKAPPQEQKAQPEPQPAPAPAPEPEPQQEPQPEPQPHSPPHPPQSQPTVDEQPHTQTQTQTQTQTHAHAHAHGEPVANGVHGTPPTTIPSTTPAPYFRRPSKDGVSIVFGAVHPAPLDIETAQQQPLPRPPPGFAPPQFTPTFFPGHSHHPSDATSSWIHPPYSIAPPDPVYANGHATHFPSPSFSAGPNSYPPLPQEHFSSAPAPFAVNGTATSHSQSPSKSQFGEVRLPSDLNEDHHAPSYQNGAPARTERLEESPFELASYLSTQFGNPEFADFILQVRSPESVLISLPVHGIVVARSPVIAEAIRHSVPPSHRSRDTRRLLDVSTSDSLVTRESLEEAIKILYGAPLLSDQSFLYGLGPYISKGDHVSSSDDARRRMGQLLSYIAAGHVLQMPSMQARGAEIAKSLTRWDTLDQILHFGLQQTRSTARSSDPFATVLLDHAVDFISYSFPVDFNLHTIAPELRDDPRLPSLLDARQPAHNPRLSKIRFGETAPELDPSPGHASQMLSTILLSLPPVLLDRIFNHRATANQIGWTGTAKIMRDVVNERENRRQKAMRSQLQPSHDGTIPGPLLDNLYVEERVEHVEPSPLYPSGYRVLATRPVG